MPVSASTAWAACFLPATVSVAVPVADVTGVNRTVTRHVFPGARLLQVLPVMANAAEPVSVTVSLPVAERPELARLNVCEAGCRMVTCP